MSAAALPVMRELELPIGEPLGGAAALAALDDNDQGEDDLEEAESLEDRELTASALAGEGASEPEPEPAKPRRAKGEKPETANQLRRRVSRLKRAEMQALYLELLERHQETERKLETATRDAAVVRAVGADVLDESVNDLVGDVVDLVDGSVQFGFMYARRPRIAQAMALEPDEREHLVRLASRVTKIRGGEMIAKRSPELALGVAVVSIALAKGIAYLVARLDEQDQAPPAGQRIAVR